jgi:hypothetical protein
MAKHRTIRVARPGAAALEARVVHRGHKGSISKVMNLNGFSDEDVAVWRAVYGN